uniref:Uncharacterized protein n=1 Tax=Anguilla anguilla TaxID=7936 RepID=A0A0E9VW00_ANGAN
MLFIGLGQLKFNCAQYF